MKIEHWQSRARFPSEQLVYQNLLGACLGGKGQPPDLQHCDARKGSSDLQWNPAQPAHHIETRVRYELDGSIRSDEAEFNDQLDQVLNLNLAQLRNSRKAVLDAILELLKREKSRIRGPVPRDRLVRERNKFDADNSEMRPFSPVAIWWLDQMLARKAA